VTKTGKILRLFALTLSTIMAVTSVISQPACRQALAIGLDISGSVDEQEYRLQLDGLALALLQRDVQAAFLVIPGANVRLFVYEWGGYGTQRTLIHWTDITDIAVLETVANTWLATRRDPHDPATAIGNAMLFGGEALASQGDCWHHTPDLSGDGKSNIGPDPAASKNLPLLADVTANALAVGANTQPFVARANAGTVDLVRYFFSLVVRGPYAFVETVDEFTDFHQAMARNLLKELRTPAVGELANTVRFPGTPDQ